MPAKQPHEMLFREFVEAVRPTGGVNKLPPIGDGDDVLTYSVYMNGPMAAQLPIEAQEHHYKDVMLHALTEKLGLDSTSFRDNMKVAECVAVRGAWMTAVLEATMMHDGHSVRLTDEVEQDYVTLTKGLLGHSWIQEQIAAQRALSKSLSMSVRDAEALLNTPLEEAVPGVVNKGVVIPQTSQNSDFTLQAVGGGWIVAHENQKLDAIPPMGEDVVISYYRGRGQVFPNAKDLTITHPFVDPRTGSLAVLVSDNNKQCEQLVLFNTSADFEKFVGAQQLPYALVAEAVAIKGAAVGKVVARVADSQQPNIVSNMAATVLSAAQAVGLRVEKENISRLLERGRGPNGTFIGMVKAVDERFGLVYQATGQGNGIVHRADSLSRIPSVGEVAIIRVKDGRGLVSDPVRGNKNEIGR